MSFVIVFILGLCCLAPVSHARAHEGNIRSGIDTEQHAMSKTRLPALRALMANQQPPLAAYIIPTADAHNSEYISPVDARRQWISGFTGSAGTAVVTAAHALLWTDGRYYTQFEREADLSYWTLMRQSLPQTPTMEKWLSVNLKEGSRVGVDPQTMTREEWTPLQTALSKVNVTLVPVAKNLVDEVRHRLGDPPPERPCNPITPLLVKYTGKTVGEKIEHLRNQMAEKKAFALVITALDEIAYILNLRGSDIEYNPVFFAYLLITKSTVELFHGGGGCDPAVVTHLKAGGLVENMLSCHPYGDIFKRLQDMVSTRDGNNHYIWISSGASEAIHRAASRDSTNIISEVSPVALMKLIKNEVELEGFRQCHIRDGIAVSRLLKWLHDEVDSGSTVTEVQASDKLLEFRKEEKDFMGPSFNTIASAGANGAIIHYSPSRTGAQKTIKKTDMFLLDSGGQYRDGTTDVTRTRHMGRSPTEQQKNAFTRVLKGQIMLGSALFPRGVKGNVLDSFARHALWDVGLDYAHGTGHGVGHYLNVHEGPAGVSWKPYPHDPGFEPGQILSNEPGYYEVGEYGIRHEDLVETVLVTRNSSHPKASGLLGDYDGRGVLGFHTLTLVPLQKECLEVPLLTDFELFYINAYQKRVLDTLGPVLKERGLVEDYQWLEQQCATIARA